MSDVIVIGCGPAGLLAAHEVVLSGKVPTILSREVQPSPHAKAVFLHEPVAGISDKEPDARVVLRKVGAGHGYAAKVYGDPEAPTSWERFLEGHIDAWALKPIYGRLWELLHPFVRECEVNAEVAKDLAESFPLVINTAPAPALCRGRHKFPGKAIWVRDGLPISVLELDNAMIYNGQPGVGWYRCSDLFGTKSTEFAHPVRGAREGIKVLPTNCDCNPKIVRAGRWGQWQPGVLLHHTVERVRSGLIFARKAKRLS